LAKLPEEKAKIKILRAQEVTVTMKVKLDVR
jgi:hypothetical protein